MLSGFPTPGPLHRRSPRLDHYHFLHLISATSLLSLLTTSCPLEMLFDRQTDRNQLCCSSCCRRCLQDHNNRCHHRTHAHTHRRTYKQHAVTAGNYFPRLGASQLCRASLSLGTHCFQLQQATKNVSNATTLPLCRIKRQTDSELLAGGHSLAFSSQKKSDISPAGVCWMDEWRWMKEGECWPETHKLLTAVKQPHADTFVIFKRW